MKLILLYGAPGTGKLTVAKELEKLTGFTLFHNHMILNALSEIFGYDNPIRKKLEKEFRLRIIEEAVKSGTNIIATGVIMRKNEEFYREMVHIVQENNGETLLVYLTTNIEMLKQRISNESRIVLNKISTIEKLEEWENQYPESFNKLVREEHITCDTTNMNPQEIADRIASYYKLI